MPIISHRRRNGLPPLRAPRPQKASQHAAGAFGIDRLDVEAVQILGVVQRGAGDRGPGRRIGFIQGLIAGVQLQLR